MEFDRLGVFTYSPEEGTPAADHADDQIPMKKSKNQDGAMKLMELQQEVATG